MNEVIKNTKNNIPLLRFSEFDGVWQKKILNEVGKFLKGGDISKSDISTGGKYKCIRYGELYTEYGEIIKDIKSKTNKTQDDSFLNDYNDVIFPSSGETSLDIARFSCVHDSNVLLGGGLNVIRPTKDNDGAFLSYYLSNYKKRDIARLAQGYSVVHLYNSHLENFSINIPSLSEQQKISDFLISIDEYIENLKKQKNNFKLYKKGMMQKIFQQKVRFNDKYGNSYPNWKKQKISIFLTERNEKAPKNEEYPLMAFVAYVGITPKGERYNREFLVNDSDGKDYKQTEYGDFIYSSNNLETGSIGLNRYGSASISPVYSIFKIKDSCDYDFIGSYLTRKSFIHKMTRYRQGVVYGQWKIHESDFLKIEENIPSLEEQKKISSYLKSIDKIIKIKEEQIVSANQWKKSLIQKVFV